MLRLMKWHASDAMCAAIVATTILRSTKAGWSANGVGFVTTLYFDVPRNSLQGPIPHAVGSMTSLKSFTVSENSLQGPIPHAVRSMRSLEYLEISKNSLQGPIPHAVGSMTLLGGLQMSENSLQGPIPHIAGSMTLLRYLFLRQNSLQGAIPHSISSMTIMLSFEVPENSLQGPVPHAVGSMLALFGFFVARNSLSGTIPTCVTCSVGSIGLQHNLLSGSIPGGFFAPRHLESVFIHGNRLIGSLPVFKHVGMLAASGNLLEGMIPNIFSSKLSLLDLSGVPGSSIGLNGPLPPALRQASRLQSLIMANQQMDGAIPSFASTLSLLALHKNLFKVLSALHIKDQKSKTVILLYDNLLSCCVPMCGNAAANISIIAIGNRLHYPRGEFPAWVSKYEHDPLLWVSGTGGMSLVQKISAAVGFFICAVRSQLGSARLLRAMSGWQSGPGTHSWLVEASSHLHAVTTMGSLVAAVFIMFLLPWDYYVCPQTLAMMSACLRSSTLIRTFVFLCWCKISFHSQAMEQLTMDGERQKKTKWTAEILTKWLLLWLLWCVITLCLSAPAILYQVVNSIPGSFQVGRTFSLGLKGCIGVTQALVGGLIVPYLAGKMPCHTEFLTTIANLVLSLVLPDRAIGNRKNSDGAICGCVLIGASPGNRIMIRNVEMRSNGDQTLKPSSFFGNSGDKSVCDRL